LGGSGVIGKTVSHYRIISKLGEGGMGEVREAHDTRLDCTVAIKLIPKHLSADPAARKRFVHEAKAASSIENAKVGQTVSHYKILEELGAGGMGVASNTHYRQRRRTMADGENRFYGFRFLTIFMFLVLGFSTTAVAQETVMLSHEQVTNIVNRSYQYVAMFNVIQKHALDPVSGAMFADGFNRPVAATTLLDHTARGIARPNNDTFYQGAVLDLRNEPIIVEFPTIDSKYVVLETSSYSHYCEVPMASSEGDFKKPTRVLFYTERTKGYQGQQIKGVDRIVKADGDFLMTFLRAMPHQAEPERMARIIQSLENVNVMALSEYQGNPTEGPGDMNFPAYGKTDADIFAENLLEVMQFIFNHTTFDAKDAMDRAVLAAYKPLGVEPGKEFDETNVAKLDGAMFRKVALELAEQARNAMTDPEVIARATPKLFMPKGQIDLETQVIQSVVGPIGLPSYQAIYVPVATKDGQVMNAQNDYVLRMSKHELPPSTAFWSLTLYDLEDGFFIPNDRKKYSVGENAGFKLIADGGIEIYVSAAKPEGVPEENWLPINREDIGINAQFRIYVPDAEKMKTWKMPQLEMLKVAE
jgi:hypothetical protein